MLECFDNMHKNGMYKGRYMFEEEMDENINKLRKLVQQFFHEYEPVIDVDIYEFKNDGLSYTKITIYIDQWNRCEKVKKYIIILGSIESLASIPEKEFYDILANATWVY